MEFVTEISRIFIPVVTVIILTKCIMALWLGHPKEKTYGYIVDMFDGERYELNMWETSIGRSSSCDITIGYDTMSRFQAVIARRNDSWYIHDLRSKSGVKVGGKKIEKKLAIKNGDILTLGNMKFRFEIADDPVVKVGKKKKQAQKKKSAPQSPSAQPQRSRKQPSQPQYAPPKKASPRPPSAQNSYTVEAPANTRVRHTPKPTLVNRDTGERFVLCGNEVSIGSSPRCDIRLRSPQASRKHALVVLYEDGWAIEDANSEKGTRLNGKKVTSPQLLFDGDVISLADERLYYKC